MKFHSATILLSFIFLALPLACQSPNLADGLYAKLQTNKGEILIQLQYESTPLTVINFVGLAEGSLKAQQGKKFYNNLSFHRVEPNFVIQGGDPNANGTGGPGYQFPNEISSNLKHDSAGIVAMANAGPDTNGSQFYITLGAFPQLDGKYSIFGKVVKGLDVTSTIAIGDKILTVDIMRVGKAAKNFKTDQQAWDAAKKTIEDERIKEKTERQKSDLDKIAATWPDVKPDADGIFQKVIKQGTGPVATKGTKVKVIYSGSFLDGKVFDKSDLHGGPAEFAIGVGQIIPGWDKILLTMRKGEKRLVIIPPDLAYGSQGTPGGPIPPNAYLVFDIELVSF